MNKTLQAHLAVLGANIIYGVNFTIAKDVMPHYIKPFGFVLLRVLGAVVLYWLVSAIMVREKVEKKDLRTMALLGICGVTINQLLFLKGLALSTPINAAIIMISNPIIVLIFATIILKEAISITRVSGVVLGLTGAAMLLLFKGDFSFGSETFVGDMLVLVNSASWAMYLIYVKPLMKKYNTITIVKWVFLFGSFYVMPFGLGEAIEIDWNGFTSYIWFAVGFVVIATTFFAYILNTYALKQLSPAVTSAYIYLQPFFAATVALLLGKDEITPIKIISALLIISGVYLVSRPVKEKKGLASTPKSIS